MAQANGARRQQNGIESSVQMERHFSFQPTKRLEWKKWSSSNDCPFFRKISVLSARSIYISFQPPGETENFGLMVSAHVFGVSCRKISSVSKFDCTLKKKIASQNEDCLEDFSCLPY